MSERAQTRLLTTLGIVTATLTVGIQVMSVGELKGKLETVTTDHERRLVDHDAKINEHTKEISEIKGSLRGVAARAGKSLEESVEKTGVARQ